MKQRAERIRVMRPTTVEIDGIRYGAVIHNISFGGVRLLTDLRPEMGSGVTLIDDQLGTVEAEVIRHTPDGFALFMGRGQDSATFALRSIAIEMMETA